VPITEFCDQNHLSVRQRLELFGSVCQAVQHAHQKGIIHRDLKPSNVLVTLHDDRPVAKVIDFGIAKAIGQQLTDKTLFTGFAQLIGTPLYMSPEQAQLSGLDVDTRSDIYSLGVLLYELLTGTTPFDQERLRTVGYDELRRIIREEEPPRPSARLSTLGPAAATVSADRQSDPRRLSQLFRGELDWIVMKCLEKDRNRRYETANGLARDLERYLHDEPVQACPPSAWYRLRKFAHRNRTAVMMSATLALALVLGAIVSTWQAIRATQAERDAIAERDAKEQARKDAVASEAKAIAETKRASEEADIAKAVIAFVQKDIMEQASFYQQVEPGQPATYDMTLRTALDRAARKIDARFTDKPLVEAAIRFTIGHVLLQLGDFAQSSRHIERVLALHRAVQGDLHAKTLEMERLLAWIYYLMDRFDESEALHRKTLVAHIEVFGEASSHTRDEMSQFGVLLTRLKKFPEAESLHLKAVELGRKTVGSNDPRVLLHINNLALLYVAQGRFAEAEKLYLEALINHRRVRGEEHPDSILVLKNLGLMYLRQAKFPEVEALSRDLNHVQKRIQGADFPSAAGALDRLAEALIELGRFETAESVMRISLRARAERQPDAWTTFGARSLLGAAMLNQENYAKAEPLLLEGFEGLKKHENEIPKGDRVRVTQALERLVRLYEATGRASEASKWRKELEARKKEQQ
jgi:non-specific serine/threonine protein kinase/serine/threonine-protein kinase